LSTQAIHYQGIESCIGKVRKTSSYYNCNHMGNSKRILSIDIMRGLTLVLMLFVNDLYMPGVPAWLGHILSDHRGP
jgi:hypothetical protein